MAESIYASPADYDLEHEGDEQDVCFYRALVDRLRPRRVLELGCGSGRVTVPLAERAQALDFDIVGIDVSNRMLEDARGKAADLAPAARRRLRLERGDLREWRDGATFDLVIVPCSTLSHILTIDDQLAAWTTASANLAAGGRFVVDVVMPDLVTFADSLQTPPRAVVQMDVDTEPDGRNQRLIRYRAVRYLPHEQRARIHFLYDRFEGDRQADRFVSDFESHVYFPRELELLFRQTGYEVETTWGDYRFGPFNVSSREIVMVGRKK